LQTRTATTEGPPVLSLCEIHVLDPSGNVERVIRSTTRIASYGAAILPLPAGTLTQLEKFQKAT